MGVAPAHMFLFCSYHARAPMSSIFCSPGTKGISLWGDFTHMTDSCINREIFERVLGRPPSPAEIATVQAAFTGPSRGVAARLWCASTTAQTAPSDTAP